MLYEKFTRLIEEHADYLTRKWLSEVKANPATSGYKTIPDGILSERVFDVYKRLGSWLLNEDPEYKNCARHYLNLGKERASEGLQISEVIYALILSRVVLWNYISESGLINNSIDLQHSLEFYSKMNNFFDKAAYFAAVGFETTQTGREELVEQEDFVEKTVHAITKWIIKVPE